MTSEECVALIKRHFQCVWMEDDALPHDRERLWPAVERLTGMRHGPEMPPPIEKVDGGDCTWLVYDQWVICVSFPGQTAIYRRLAES